jgi:mono/diheme cytochrome c family protein
MRFAAALLSLTTYCSAGVYAADTAPLQQHGDVARGSYLVRAGDCASCHTVAGGQPFAGGLYMPTPFGRISVPNITPDPQTGIGGWSDEAFYKAMHEGIGRSGENLYPVFPFPWYTKLTRADVSDIKAYLVSLPPVRAPRRPLELSWPASERETLTAWRTLFFTPGEFKPNPGSTPEINRGAYLVEGLGHCGECHNQRNVVGVSRWSGNLEGGAIEGWYAPNLTADNREGIGSWSVAELTQFLKSGAGPHVGVALGPMREVISESLSHLSSADLQAMAAYLKSVPPKEKFAGTVTSEFAGSHPPGSSDYLTFCGSCHGVHGEGVSHEIPALARNGAVLAQGPENVLRVVLGGLPAIHGLSPMPAVGVGMSDAQVANTVNYVRNAFGNAAPGSAEPGLVAKIRAETHSTLAGNPEGGCAPVSDADMNAQLEHMNESNMLQVIDRMLPKLRAAALKGESAHKGAAAPGGGTDAPVNQVTEAYCAVLTKQSVSAATRSMQLGNFAVLVYGQLRDHRRG